MEFSFSFRLMLLQGCTNSGRQVAVATRFSAAPNIRGSSAWNKFHNILLVHRILSSLVNSWNVYAPLFHYVLCYTAVDIKQIIFYWLLIYLKFLFKMDCPRM
jgi:hypothetical protein